MNPGHSATRQEVRFKRLPLGPSGEVITWPDQVDPRGRKASSPRKIKPQTSNLNTGYWKAINMVAEFHLRCHSEVGIRNVRESVAVTACCQVYVFLL